MRDRITTLAEGVNKYQISFIFYLGQFLLDSVKCSTSSLEISFCTIVDLRNNTVRTFQQSFVSKYKEESWQKQKTYFVYYFFDEKHF